jgi:hypothetical protein
VRAALTPEAFAAAWARGRAYSATEAVAEGLGHDTEVGRGGLWP